MEKFDFDKCNYINNPFVFYILRNCITYLNSLKKIISIFPKYNHIKLPIRNRIPHSVQHNRMHKMDYNNMLILFENQFNPINSIISKSEYVRVHCFIFGVGYKILGVGSEVQCQWMVSRLLVFRFAAFIFVYISIFIPIVLIVLHFKRIKMVQ